MEYLDLLPEHVRTDALTALHAQRQRWVNQDKKGFLRYRRPSEALAAFHAARVDCCSDTVILGDTDEIDEGLRQQVRQHLLAFKPWRKGPFSVFGIDVDAEWRSNRKWQRLLPFLPDLKGRTIADIGCNNGYYMFRMAAHRPRLVLGFEPSVQHYYCFRALNGIAAIKELAIDLLGVEHLPLFPACFDVIFLMGVIYHRPSPIDTLRDVFTALVPGGTVIVESQAIPGDDPVALFPETTYAKAPGVYFVPTATCLRHWMVKAGFEAVETFGSHPMSSSEQRRTEWMDFESYSDFIRPDDPQTTIEGYPAPHRVFLRGRKKG
ncbi:tRNA 5-methoxyuridine(34)/uridine 5-oxyacetic acid(34) synthase CmoB [Desulfoprunum benzoelyticum]|uniref:tRNA (Mo5U34)-methyltransferase n=1 Tax=Desulfoprunum benzoelyticum TaxID=1506996 RepID=A0A840USG6_9BACT|nr:tRNA 5-methoxyuridine(34)/uridine 5-oxyacetic acid(34) synthase CmoB [Desulfoprunum benzoelyticum]MBB5349157.1 tRNA (mo5U34)-methyltransferase [Desulfoprunum benzoelyticum]MBM9530606.1 tRNA 5-methoxyuridine(34)/uridine 5-oxyacetic acid(34) synthase CmoB [Desulfoprunum benzoelyticum]